MVAAMRIGIDLGGTKIEGVVLDAEGQVLQRRRVATPKGDYPGTVDALCGLVATLEAKAGKSCSVGFATPGAVSCGLMKNCNSTWLNGKPLKADLEAILAREVRLANDADCMALSEATDGAGQGAATVFGVILGTGVGGGFVINGQLLQGPNSITGEWGHNPLPWVQPEDGVANCYCGLSGCIEAYLSGPALERRCSGMAARDIGARQSAEAIAVMELYCHQLARALASVINVIDPEVIVLAGGLSNIDYLYKRVSQLWGQWVFTGEPLTRLVKADYGDASGVRGAAWLWN